MGDRKNQLTTPLSPIVHSRLNERTDLQNLNDRFASYIESVRILQGDNSRLQATLESAQESYDREKLAMKKLYEEKLAETRKSLQEISSEKAKLSIEYTQALVNNDNLKCELGSLRQKFEETQENLKNETVVRVDLETTVRLIREEIILRDQLHNEELDETLRQVNTSDIHDITDDNDQLQESLQELRDQCANQIRFNRNELESLLDDVMRKERDFLQRENKSLSSALECSSNRNDVTHMRIGELEKLNGALNTQIHHLELTLEEEKSRCGHNAAELKTIRQEMESLLIKYQNLKEENVSLCLELAAFNKLLCNEEQCSKFEPGTKRCRQDIGFINDRTVTSSSMGNIEIVDIDSAGKFVKLRNISENEAISLGGWKLKRQADALETIYEFGSSDKVDAAADLTVWSADSGVSASLVDILDAEKWIAGNETKITLVNGSGKEEAKRIQKKVSRRCDGLCRANEEAEKKEQKCKVM